MRKLVLLFILPLFFACNPVKVIVDEGKTKMLRSMNGVYGLNSLDSMLEVDTLPYLDKWHMLGMRDEEDRTVVKQYIYIKGDTVYRVEPVGEDSVKITQRISK